MELITKQTDDIILNPDNFPEEQVAAEISRLKNINYRIWEAQKKLENNLIERMEKEGATKLPIINEQGQGMTITLKPGKRECKDKQVEDIYKGAGFDPLEIGKYEFVPSWSRAKKVRKLGGYKKDLIDELFKENKKTLLFE